MKNKLTLLILSIAFTCVGCATTSVNYTPPGNAKEITSVVLKDPFEAAWTKSVRALGGSFFVMNNIVKDSKIINLSYSGDPEKYVDCGQVSVSVSGAAGSKVYSFPGARRNVQFQMAREFNTATIDRQMSLDGRINILFEEQGTNETHVKVVVRYVLTRTGTQVIRDELHSRTSTVPLAPVSFSFNTGGSDSAPGDAGMICRPTGELEKALIEILSAAHR
jgi:hypothetical protein